jgi:hypothetical protein
MMSKERELLEKFCSSSLTYSDWLLLRTEAEELLAQPKQGFVGYLYKQKDCYGDWGIRFKVDKPYITSHEIKDIVPVYTAPPKQKPLSYAILDKQMESLKIEQQDAFWDGIEWAEQQYGIIGDRG